MFLETKFAYYSTMFALSEEKKCLLTYLPKYFCSTNDCQRNRPISEKLVDYYKC